MPIGGGEIVIWLQVLQLEENPDGYDGHHKAAVLTVSEQHRMPVSSQNDRSPLSLLTP